MRSRSRISFLALTGALWIVPSIGTQGMGTIGQRVTHPDAALIADGTGRLASRDTLAKADALVEDALSF